MSTVSDKPFRQYPLCNFSTKMILISAHLQEDTSLNNSHPYHSSGQELSFSELSSMISSVIELGKAAVTLKDIPVKQRRCYREIIYETHFMLDSALVLIIARLTDILLIAERDKSQFRAELKKLDSDRDWMQLERNVRLCRPLREAAAEMRSLETRLKNRISLKDRQALNHLIDYTLNQGERTLAEFISRSLHDLSMKMDEPGRPSEVFNRAVDAVRKTKDDLKLERSRLLESEMKFLDTI